MVAFFQSELEACLAPRAALRASSTGQQRAKLFVLTRELRRGTSSSWGGHYIRADFYLITVTVSCRSDKQIPKLHQQPSEHWGSFPLWKSDCCNVFTQPEDCPSSPHHFMMGMSSMNRRKHPQCPVSSFQWKNDRKYPVLPVRPPPVHVSLARLYIRFCYWFLFFCHFSCFTSGFQVQEQLLSVSMKRSHVVSSERSSLKRKAAIWYDFIPECSRH